jgi:hypothetical protein
LLHSRPNDTFLPWTFVTFAAAKDRDRKRLLLLLLLLLLPEPTVCFAPRFDELAHAAIVERALLCTTLWHRGDREYTHTHNESDTDWSAS